MVDPVSFSLTCLCMPGIVIAAVISIAMAYGLYRYIDRVPDDFTFRVLFLGSVLFAVSQVVAVGHAWYSNFYPAIWVPELQAYTVGFELIAYILIFGAMQQYFMRFTEG